MAGFPKKLADPPEVLPRCVIEGGGMEEDGGSQRSPDYDNNIPPAAFDWLFWLTFLLLLTGVSTEDGGVNVSWMAGGVNFNILSGQILWRMK